MKAVQVESAGGAFEVVDRDVPEPAADEVRLDVAACGVCGGDSAAREGAFPGIEYPRVPGHEVAGRVDAVGADVTTWSVGDRVATGWYAGHCGACGPCRRGAFVHCETGPPVTGIHADGGYAEYMLATPESLAPVPDELDAVAAAPLTCAGMTAFNVLRHCGARPGDLVAVQGIGGVGHLGLQYARAAGFETVAVSRSLEKRAVATDLGADRFVDADATDPAEALREMGGARAILATAPSSAAMESITGGLGADGELLIVGAPHGPVEVPVDEFIDGRRSVRGWDSGHAGDTADALDFSVLRDVDPMVETFPLERAAEAYERMQNNDVRFRAVLTPGR